MTVANGGPHNANGDGDLESIPREKLAEDRAG